VPRYWSIIHGDPKSTPLPNDQKVVLNRNKARQWD